MQKKYFLEDFLFLSITKEAMEIFLKSYTFSVQTFKTLYDFQFQNGNMNRITF